MNNIKSVECNTETQLLLYDSDNPDSEFWEFQKEIGIYPCRYKDDFINSDGTISLILNPDFFKMFAFDMIDIDSKNGYYSYKQPFLFNNIQLFDIMNYLSNGNRLCECKYDVNNYHQRNPNMIQCAIICDNNDDIKKDINYYRNNYCSCIDNLSNNRYIHTCPCHYLYVVIDEQRDKGCFDNDDTDKKRIYMDDLNSIYEYYKTKNTVAQLNK